MYKSYITLIDSVSELYSSRKFQWVVEAGVDSMRALQLTEIPVRCGGMYNHAQVTKTQASVI